MNILVTGGAGFIGSNFINHMLSTYEDYKIYNLDLLTYAGNLENLNRVKDKDNYQFIKGNIVNEELVDHIVKEHKINCIVNFAAESHVDRSITNPNIFVETNVNGTMNLLNIAKKNNIQKYVQVSTDEVYGSLGKEGFFTEKSPLAPNSPYSASKASADLLVLSYYETYGMNINITRCSNNYGPYHHPEKLIPLMVTNGIQNKKMPIYGDGENIRDWLYVDDHCEAIDLVLHKGVKGEVYNIGGNNERTNNEIVDIIINELGVADNLKEYVADRLGHDRRYAIDPSKIVNELGWKPKFNFDTGIIKTIKWYVDNENWWRSL
ncbi:dTDP-glucose 4,6-dehydratase [Marinilactibacillus kalidii]|uniref:dTDP-glucose 4,6-dehydratase n=1 Tax=Marinilactibacillus kalidii TaxID=2820274 RepID=UPI001ABED803|nr:dTDP-glucose 4,6-dehydratase [Marinilactibacillus kalidii]